MASAGNDKENLNGSTYLDEGLPSICGALVLERDECIVALGEDGTGWIIVRSDDLIECDVLLEATAEDNGFNLDWDKGLLVGVYKLKIHPWASGEDEAGIDVKKVTPLWTVPEPTDRKIFESGWLDRKDHETKHLPIVYSPSETMVMLLLIRKANLWRVVDSEEHRHKMLQLWYEDAWWDFCRTDLKDNVATLFTQSSNDPNFWDDPLARIVDKWSYGLRADPSDNTLYLVDRSSDG